MANFPKVGTTEPYYFCPKLKCILETQMWIKCGKCETFNCSSTVRQFTNKADAETYYMCVFLKNMTEGGDDEG